MNEDILVSVVVPAYNVEKYIAQCLLSIFGQDHNNIELIVINDGSTDNTLEILNSFKDERMIIVNQDNRGVSFSRNVGLDLAKGKYVVFVDGDDFLLNDFISSFVELAEKYGSDFVFSTKCISTKKHKANPVASKTIGNEDATATLLNPDVIVGCWNKIYRVGFLREKSIRFCTNLFYGEGLNFFITASQFANNVVVTNLEKYCYRRNNEFSATASFNIDKYLNGEQSLYSIRNNLISKSKLVYKMWDLHMAMFCLGAVSKISFFKLKKTYKNEYKNWLSCLRKKTLPLFFKNNITLYRKFLLLGGCFFPGLMGKFENNRKKRIAKNSFV